MEAVSQRINVIQMVSYFNILEKRITLTLGDEPKLLKSLQ